VSKQTIGIGASANDGTGDPLRTAMDKTNDNFTEVYTAAVEPTYFYFSGRMARIGFRDDAVVIDKSLTGSWGTEDVDWVELTSFDNV
jgi:hypothetical protein